MKLEELLRNFGPPVRLRRIAMPSTRSPGTPVLLLSDLHFGEVVDPEATGGTNAYNTQIAKARLRDVADRAVELWQHHLVHRKQYTQVVLVLAGDIISGVIHDELLATNDSAIMQQILDVVASLEDTVRRLEKLAPVCIVAVPGNHGRVSSDKAYKQYARQSFDWLIYQVLARITGVPTFAPASDRVQIEIARHRVLVIHGNQFRGGVGQVGASGPIIRGARALSTYIPHDLLLCGHWHTTIITRRVVANGSLVGASEYSLANPNLLPEPPTQVAFTLHPEHGITWVSPIYPRLFLELYGK